MDQRVSIETDARGFAIEGEHNPNILRKNTSQNDLVFENWHKRSVTWKSI